MFCKITITPAKTNSALSILYNFLPLRDPDLRQKESKANDAKQVWNFVTINNVRWKMMCRKNVSIKSTTLILELETNNNCYCKPRPLKTLFVLIPNTIYPVHLRV